MSRQCTRYSSIKMPSSFGEVGGSTPVPIDYKQVKVFNTLEELQGFVDDGFFVFVFGGSISAESQALSGVLILEGAILSGDLRDYVFLGDMIVGDLLIEYVNNGNYPRSVRFHGNLYIVDDFAEEYRGVFSYYKNVVGLKVDSTASFEDPCDIELVKDLVVSTLSSIQLVGSYFNSSGVDFNVVQSSLLTSIAPIDSQDPTKYGLVTYNDIVSGSDTFSTVLAYGSDTNLFTNQIINPPSGEGSFGTPNDMGNFIPIDAKIRAIQIGISRFIVASGQLNPYIDFEIRYVDADGSRVSSIQANSGILLDTVRFSLEGFQGVGERHDIRIDKRFSPFIGVPNSAMIFIVVSDFNNVQQAIGCIVNLATEVR